MTTVEHWTGVTQWDRPVQAKLIHADIWPANAWRVEWGPPGVIRSRELFKGPTMETDARTFLKAKLAELGNGWKLLVR